MVLHIGATKKEGQFVVCVVFEDKWWLCDDTTVKGASPPRTPRKATFPWCKRKPTNLMVLDMSHSASQRTRALALRNKGDAQSMPTDTSSHGAATGCFAPPPPHATQGPSGVEDRNMNMHARSMPSNRCVAALAPLPHACSNQQDITFVGVKQPSSEFVEAVAQLLQKRKVQVERHLHACGGTSYAT